MSSSTITVYRSDLSNDEIKTDSPTVAFGLDGQNYEVDLTSKEADKLRSFLATYVEAGRKAGKGKAKTATGPTAAEARAWLVANGHTVSAKGRLTQEQWDTFNAG